MLMKKEMTSVQLSALRRIPAIEKLLASQSFLIIQNEFSRNLITEVLRSVILDIRRQIVCTPEVEDIPDESMIAEMVQMRLRSIMTQNLQPIVNVTGTITHTNLGRSILSDEARESLVEAAKNYVSLEFDLISGKRGHRDRITEPLLQQLTGCQASTVVNNNAAAVFLVLNTFARDREVVVSRGELIEIGGSFRIPDVMESSGTILKEVGTTNRTHLEDYEKAINENTAFLLKVHPSNYQIVGFTEMPAIHEIVELGRQYDIPTVEDLGSGSLIDLTEYSLPNEPVVRDRIDAGVDLVLFSGDKLLGGPQAGIIVGKDEMIKRIRKNPVMRALRVGKLTIAALEATLRLYLNDLSLDKKLPMLHWYTRPLDELQQVGNQLLRRLGEIFKEEIQVSIEKSHAQIGSGSLPVANLPSLAIILKSERLSADSIAESFRNQPRSVIGRVKDDCFWIDLRTVDDREIQWICEAARSINKKENTENT
ncbi:uncharacterized protein METZ01_LOCUS138951 [marine metagenome]|uniref:L-seryl-tRNA selenium transferase N-terminal domain-containing protein n=1 Tax=marine metagenome TaxID=408172 RepID=A0A381ZBE2_9ZZZZ